MSWFAAVLTRSGDRWRGEEAVLEDCESLEDLGEVLRDASGDVRLLVIEQDDEYAAIVRLDASEDDPRAFLSDGHAADQYPMAAVVALELAEVGAGTLEDDEIEDDELGSDDLQDDPLLGADAPPVHDSAPLGEADVVEDLGTSAATLLTMCEHEGTLPVDLLLAVCEKAGCGEVFEELRG